MSQITIDTERIKIVLLYALALIGCVFLVMFAAWSLSAHYGEPKQTVQPVVIQPAPTLTPVPTPAYPSVLTFTVLSTTVSSGHYQAYTTTGQTLYFADYSTWDSLWPQYTYIGNVVGMDGSAYVISSVIFMNGPQNSYQQYPYDYSQCGYWMSPNYCDQHPVNYAIKYNGYYYHGVKYTPGYRIIDSGVLYGEKPWPLHTHNRTIVIGVIIVMH
jgi:hypothetical protein